jgi:hypothetical protein
MVPTDALAVHGITAAEVHRRCPHAVEYRALDGRPCWLRDDLTELLGSGREVRP